MKNIHLNLLESLAQENDTLPFHDSTPLPPRRPRARIAKRLGVVFFSLLILLTGTTAYSYYATQNDNSPINRTFQRLNVAQAISRLRDLTKPNLQGEKDKRINVLLIGIGGDAHEGGQLADTIIIMSIDPVQKRAAMFSLPRDLLVEIPGHGLRKINNAQAFGEFEEKGTGPTVMKKVVEDTFGIPIHYYIRADFDGFAKIVDILGGLNIDVDHSFTDYEYPTLSKKYQTISFAAGKQIMDGQTALMYARSRHSLMNNEGSDFARSKRQQKILAAIREKVLSTDFLLNPKKISAVTDELRANITTNFSNWEMLQFAHLMQDVDTSTMTNVVFDDGPQGFLYPDTLDGAFVLRPKGGSFDAMKTKIQNIFGEENIVSSHSRDAKIVIKNGTRMSGLALTASDILTKDGFEVLYYGNAANRDAQKTVIYDLTNGKKSEALMALSKSLNADVIQGTLDETEKINTDGADFVVIIGRPLE